MDYKGHTGFVFAIDSLPTGEIISAGDDCVVKVWDGGECKQTIQMPRTIWSLAHNKLGDLIVGCEDKSFKTFTKDSKRRDEGADYTEY
jgi:phospholipase A-2-activating protein